VVDAQRLAYERILVEVIQRKWTIVAIARSVNAVVTILKTNNHVGQFRFLLSFVHFDLANSGQLNLVPMMNYSYALHTSIGDQTDGFLLSAARHSRRGLSCAVSPSGRGSRSAARAEGLLPMP
jgi:hypothetical protein